MTPPPGGECDAGTASAFPAEPTAEHAAPVAAEGHGSEADTLARAAMAAAAHATAAAHRFLFGDSGATLSDGSTYSIWGRQMAGNAESKVTEEATAGSTTGNKEEQEQQVVAVERAEEKKHAELRKEVQQKR